MSGVAHVVVRHLKYEEGLGRHYDRALIKPKE